MSYGLALGWGGTYRGLCRVLGGLIKVYTTYKSSPPEPQKYVE